jgi:hypothetical protein
VLPAGFGDRASGEHLCPGRGDRNLERQMGDLAAGELLGVEPGVQPVMGEQLGVCAPLDHPAGSTARMMSAPSPNPPTMTVAPGRTAATASATARAFDWGRNVV